MTKKYVVAFFIAVLIFAAAHLWTTEKSSTLTLANIYGDAVVNKIPGEPFKVSITFKNIGATEGSWMVNIALEGDLWSQAGIPKELHLNPGETATLTWNGTVPVNAPVDSVVRLVVYYDDSFTALNWWIRVISAAQLSIQSSSLE
ncbi:MAG: hypothetical protein WHU54_09315 [Candidatus Bathyarchaeia archaeon]|jgi:hypothetical protein